MEKSKVILITGASSGFGKESAKKLLMNGHRVYATARRLELMKDLEELGAHVHHLDVTDGREADKVVKLIIEEQGRIDVLFNNAGYGSFGTIENIPLEEIKRQYDVNVFGVARLTQAVLPHMRREKKGLIINAASVVGHISTPVLGWYASTKHALRAMSEALRMEVAACGIDVVIIEPGAVKTGFEEVALDELNRREYPKDYKRIVDNFTTMIRRTYQSCPDAESTVDAVVKAIESRKPKLRYRTTLDAKVLPRLKCLLGDRLFAAAVRSRLS
jgi:short-subunit dehydrogenase